MRWRVPGRRDAGRRRDDPTAPRPPDRAPAGAARPTARSRAAIEEDLRGLRALRSGLRTGDVHARSEFGEIVTRRADRLLDELLRLPAATTSPDRRRAR